MTFVFDEDLKIAYKKSDEVLEKLGNNFEKPIRTADIVNTVSEIYDCKINMYATSFSELDPKIKKVGAMMRAYLNDSSITTFEIYLNSDKDVQFQRFSLLHELGYIAMGCVGPFFTNDKGFILSANTNYNIIDLPEDYKENKILLKEQLANIFALRIAMPNELFYKIINEQNDLDKIAKFFGIKKNAVFSRIMLAS